MRYSEDYSPTHTVGYFKHLLLKIHDALKRDVEMQKN